MKYFSLFILFFNLSQVGFAQKEKDITHLADSLFAKADYIGFTKAVPENTFENSPDVLNLLGFAWLNIGRNDLALQYLQKSIALYLRDLGENHAKTATCYNNLGLAYWNSGNEATAIEFLQKALYIRQQLYGKKHEEIASAYLNLGLVHSTYEPEKALSYYQEALGIYQEMLGLSHPKVALTYNNIGIIHRKNKDYFSANAFFEESLAIWKKIHKQENPTIAFVYSNMAETFFEENKYEEAEKYLQQAIDIYEKYYGNKHPETAALYVLLGKIYLIKGRFQTGFYAVQKSIVANVPDFSQENIGANPTWKNYYNPTTLISSFVLKAQLLEANYEYKSLKVSELQLALQSLRLADTLLNHVRNTKLNKADKIALGSMTTVVYEEAIRICYTLSEVTLHKKKYLEEAFIFNEKNKSAVLLGAIADADAKEFAKIPQELLENEKQILAEIAYYEQKLASGADKVNESVWRNQLFELNRKYDVFTATLEKQFPDYYNLKYNTTVASVKEIQQKLQPKQAILSYFQAERNQKIYLFHITPQKFEVLMRNRPENFDKILSAFRKSINHQVQSTYQELGYQLYQKLLPASTRKAQLITIIPDGRMGVLPFEAFLFRKVKSEEIPYHNLPYLIKKQAIAYSYSATLWIQNATTQNTHTKGILLCAPVTFENQLDKLPETEIEVQTISQLFAEKNIPTSIFTYQKANEHIFKSDSLKMYRYLHLATHGIVNEIHPELSEIFLAYADSIEDGHLYAGEIYNLDINADLVVLSACQTGLGKISKGEGVIGLSRALLYAGASNLMVSLWSVSDHSTSMLMTNFYWYILRQSENSYALSAQQAKLNLITTQRKFAAPYYWAAFILIGK